MNTVSTSDSLRDFMIKELENHKANDIAILNLKNKSSLADYIIISSGRSTKNVASIADRVSNALKQKCGIDNYLEGMSIGQWVVLDAGDVILHVFHPEIRNIYNLEKLCR